MDQAIYQDGRRLPCGDLSDELAALRATAGQDFIWIGLKDPTAEEFGLVNDELGLHPLAVEDAVRGKQRAKIELYDDTVFVVLKTLRYVDATSDVETGEVMIFLGDRFVVTVRRGDLNPLTGIRAQLEAEPERLADGPASVLYAIVDSVVDKYTFVDSELLKDLEDIEVSVFSDDTTVDSRDIYRLKREVLEVRRATTSLLPPLEMLHQSPRSPIRSDELRLSFRDVTDHLTAVIDHIESYDRLLGDILDAHLAQITVGLTEVTVQQNTDMRKISGWVAILAWPTMVAGIYGMNFTGMPELEWPYGYPMAIGVMLIGCVSIWALFKRFRWL